MKRIFQFAVLFSLAATAMSQGNPPPVLLYTLVDGVPAAAAGSGTVLPGGNPPAVLCYGLNGSGQPAPCDFSGGGGSGTVTSVAGDGVVEASSPAITTSGSLTLANAAAETVLGNYTGSSAPPTYNKVALAAVATESADTFVGNASGSTASPTAVAMPSGCTTGVNYSTSTHTWTCPTPSSGGFNPFSTGSGLSITPIVAANWSAIGSCSGGNTCGSFSTINGFGGTNGAISIVSPTGGNTNGPFAGVSIPVSGSSWTHTFVIAVGVSIHSTNGGGQGPYTCICVSDGTKWEGFFYGGVGGTPELVTAAALNSVFSTGGSINNANGLQTLDDYIVPPTALVVQLSYASGTITGSYSPDGGVTFIPIFIDTTPYLTPSVVAVINSTRGSGNLFYTYLESYQ